MALYKNVGMVGLALQDAYTAETDITATGIVPITRGVDSGLYTPRLPLPIDILPANPIIPNIDEVPVQTVTTPAAATATSDRNWKALIGLGSLYYTLVTGKGLVIQDEYVSVGASIALIIYSLK
jgi:hypothetical protein